ncbi:hypothetical protein PSDVSF_24720 [Pseudodesulfovibrio sediminis]|uniref:Solute-binding protein family 3/N-terminal domain-containing protein n=2 Tax=Pseudodesulfovibrio sediminis TaxID=2810563 RepID=A0ABM7P8C4_9BACT|nr:hypothetical protein PSDVSF_24720 [Pseudodesulfovibrio sediminis]
MASGYPEWQPPKAVIFGMPYLGQAVKKGGTGLVSSILKAVFDGAGYAFQHKDLPYKRALKNLRAGTIDCTLDIKDKQKGVAQAAKMLVAYDLAVAYLRTRGFKDIKELDGQRVAYLHGFDIQSVLPVQVKPQLSYDLSSAFHMLDRGHVTYIIDDEQLLKDALYESKLPTSAFMITKIRSMEVHPIFTDNEKGRKLRDVYDRRMREMTVSGELEDILKANGMSDADIKIILDANKSRNG